MPGSIPAPNPGLDVTWKKNTGSQMGHTKKQKQKKHAADFL